LAISRTPAWVARVTVALFSLVMTPCSSSPFLVLMLKA